MGKIDKVYYDKSSYFDTRLEVFQDLSHPFQRYRVSKVLQIYTPGKNEKVLDLGCGWGTFCFTLAPKSREVVGLDFSKKSIDICKKLLKKTRYKNVKFVCVDAKDTGLKSSYFDVIFAADLFEHLYPKESLAVLNECKRLLRSSGKLVIWTPNRGHVIEALKNRNIILRKDISHVDYKSMEKLLRDLKKRGFKILKSYYAESHIPVFQLLERTTLSFLPFMRRRIAILAQKI